MYQAIKEGLAECACARAWKGNTLEFCLNLPRESMRLLAADIVGGMLRVKPLTKRAALGRWFLVVFRMQHPLERHDGKLVCLYEQYRWDITEGATPHDAIRRSFDFENEIEDELPDMAPRCVFVRVEKNGLSSFLFEEVLEPRPFKAIILGLAGSPAIKQDLRLIKRKELDEAEKAVFVGDTDPDEERCAMLTVMRDGSAVIEFTATAEQLDAIAAACQELTAGREEEV